MQQVVCHHANHFAEQLCADIAQHDNKLITVIQSEMDTALVAPLPTRALEGGWKEDHIEKEPQRNFNVECS